jgi:hypothetical protein
MTRTVAIFGLAATMGLFAQENADEAKTKEETAATAKQIVAQLLRIPKRNTNEKMKAADVTSGLNPSLSAYNVFQNLVIPPGQNLLLTSQQDWAGADHASVAIECPASTSLQKVGIVMTWTIPIANFYTITDVISGSNFLLQNQGGAVVPTYGNMLQIIVVNTGPATVACDQLTAYAIVH